MLCQPDVSFEGQLGDTALTDEDGNTARRSGRARRPTWKVVDMQPEELSTDTTLDDPDPSAPSTPPALTPSSLAADQALPSALQRIWSTVNKFGLSRMYPRLPVPTQSDTPEHNTSTISTATPARHTCSITDIIFPYPNLSSWRFAHHFWSGSGANSLGDREAMQEVICSADFDPHDLVGVNFRSLDHRLENAQLPWQDSSHGWQESTVTIGIPTGIKSKQASRKANAAASRRAAAGNVVTDAPPEVDANGLHFEVKGFWHRSITSVIRSVFGHDDAAKPFQWRPFENWHTRPGMVHPERVFDELYTSDAWLEADKALQESVGGLNCTRPKVIAALMFSSDSTRVAQDGQAKLWLVYMYFGNQSKNIRCRPNAQAAHHIAYIPSVGVFS